MKKSLLALAVLAASGVAMAQSSVTLYGVADIGVHKVTDKSFSTMPNGNGTSRIGVKGVEDLGGGLKASFNIEQGVNLGTGATDAAGTFQRAAFLQLDGNFGSVYAGRRLSPMFYSAANYELTGMANYSNLATMFGFGANPAPRNSNHIAYTTPSISGFKGTLGTTLKGDQSGNNGADTEFTATYNQGPIALSAGYETQAFLVGESKKYGHIGGSYNFGNFTLAASYQDPSGAQKGFTIGGKVMMGTTSLILDIARDTGSATKSTDYLLEAVQPLSKRTFVYGLVHGVGKRTPTGKTITDVGMGVRHNF